MIKAGRNRILKKHFRDPMRNPKISQFSVPVKNISLMDQSGLSGCVSAIY